MPTDSDFKSPPYKRLFLLTPVVFVFLMVLACMIYFWLNRPGFLYQGETVSKGAISAGAPSSISDNIGTGASNFNISIISLDINAPVQKNVDGSRKKDYLAGVLQGVAHYKHKVLPDVTVDGALPGEVGNIFLFGHSQIPGGDPSNFKGVFNRLPEIKIGERVQISYQDKLFDYEVYEAKVIDKSEISYLEKTPQETLTLMTCWPLGLDIKRFVVRARRVN